MGDEANTHNYRGINIINSIAKLYDLVLSERLCRWFRPYREQAGAQRKRGCIEHYSHTAPAHGYGQTEEVDIICDLCGFL